MTEPLDLEPIKQRWKWVVENDPHGEMSWGHEDLAALVTEVERLRSTSACGRCSERCDYCTPGDDRG